MRRRTARATVWMARGREKWKYLDCARNSLDKKSQTPYKADLVAEGTRRETIREGEKRVEQGS